MTKNENLAKGATMKQLGPQLSTPTDIKFRRDAYQRMLAAERAKLAERSK
jgi:hypothetical protein